MWTRSLLKNNAKAVLRQRYWQCLLACLITDFLGGFSTDLADLIGLIPSFFTIGYRYSIDYYIVVAIFLSLLIAMLLGSLGVIFSIFVSNPLLVGSCRFMMESRYGNAPLETLFSTFRKPYGNVIKVMLLRKLQVFLWSMLFLVPGIYKQLQYFAVPYLLAENPYLSFPRACELSKAMTEGEKWNIFVLHLSFLGWILLAALASQLVSLGLLGGVGVIFLNPYMQATYAELYAALRAKAFSLGITDESELAGFVRY